MLLPALASSGYITAGNQVVREAKAPDYVQSSLDDANLSDKTLAQIGCIAGIGLGLHLALVALPFAARGVRSWHYRRRRPPMLTYPGGRAFAMLAGATVLETLRENRIAHASVCGGRTRCTTCGVLVTKGLDRLPAPAGLEAKALTKIGATAGTRLACQITPTSDIAIVPLLAADASAADGATRGGLEGSERPIAVVFVDMRSSTTLGEARMPYDVLFILNNFYSEMTKALNATNGHYSHFTGDGLMALYGCTRRTPRPARPMPCAARARCSRASISSTGNWRAICRSRCGSASAFIKARRSSARWGRRARKSSPRSATP